MKIRIMTFNIQHALNFVTRKIDFDVMADAIRKVGADIVGLEEVRGEGLHILEYREQAKILAEKLGFYYYFGPAIRFCGVDPYGNALLSRYPIVSAETVKIPDPAVKKYSGYYETRDLIKCRIDTGSERPLTVCVSHFGLNPDEHENCAATAAASVEPENCILMGDFNMTPDNPLLAPIREKMRDTADCFPEPLLSFPSDAPRCKIDYIFSSPDVKVLGADIPAIVASDHRPVYADIEY